jgi:antitoxin ParD1/3/4
MNDPAHRIHHLVRSRVNAGAIIDLARYRPSTEGLAALRILHNLAWQELPRSIRYRLRRIALMATMNISLPDEMKLFVEAQMAHEGYASASEYVRVLIREAQKRQAKRELESKFREALESGPATEMTPEDWVALRAEALDGLRGEEIRP